MKRFIRQNRFLCVMFVLALAAATPMVWSAASLTSAGTTLSQWTNGFFSGTFEVDGATQLDGATAINGALTLASTVATSAITTFGNQVILDDGVTHSPLMQFIDSDDETVDIQKQQGAAGAGNLDITTAADDGVRIMVGNLRVGNGTAGTTLNGEDFYCEGTSEFDGAERFDGAATFNSTTNHVGAATFAAAAASFVRTSQTYLYAVGRVGATAGWTQATDDGVIACPQSITAGTFIIPITGLHVGDIITAYKIIGKGTSAGNTETLDARLWKNVVVSGATGAAAAAAGITQVSSTAANVGVTSSVASLTVTVAAGEQYFVLITATTGASTTWTLGGVEVTVTQQ